MKTQTLVMLAAVSLFPVFGFAQNPPAPPSPATPAIPATPATPVTPLTPPKPDADDDDDNDSHAPKVAITFLGVETSEVPTVVAEQLGLAKGFGLVVDYVVPNGPAATAGLQQNDILKMYNDQILTEPDQLAKLVRSNAEGTNVSLTVLRKGAETKLNAKLGKREVPQRRNNNMRHWKNGKNFGFNLGPEFEQKMEALGEKLRSMDFSSFDQNAMMEQVRAQARDAQNQVRDSQREAHEGMREAQRGAQEAQRGARQAAREAARAARDAARQFRVTRRENGALKTTRIDMDRAQIVYHDDQGELKLENVSGKKILTAKDAQGRLVYSGPVETKEELDKMPPEVRARFEKLEQKDLPALAPNVTKQEEDANDAAESDRDTDNDNDESDVQTSVLQVTNRCTAPASSTNNFDLNIVRI
ncbi:MAG: PDZ domain-containing protein [Chthoniobacterales bacterium]